MTDLSWLESAKPVATTFQKPSRGRQPGKNVMEAHVVASYGSPTPLALEVPADKAHLIERAIRRAGTAHGWKMSVQALKVNPESAGSGDVIPLRELPTLEAGSDIWLTWKAEDKTAAEKAAEANGKPANAEAPADPFISAEDGTDASTENDGAAADESGDADAGTESATEAPARKSGRFVRNATK